MSVIFHTKSIFERMCRDIPPLVPDQLQEDLSNALEQVQDNMSLGLEELEDTMISFAKKLWPYREAFLEFYKVNEGEMGETFLLSKLTPHMKKKYRMFKESGGTFRELHQGGPAVTIFTPEERALLCEALVDVASELVDYTNQELLTVDRAQYEKKIAEFKDIFKDIEDRLDALRVMADEEQEHPTLAAEIRSHIRGFEHGMALLGPRMDYEAVCSADEYFQERKKYKVLKRHDA